MNSKEVDGGGRWIEKIKVDEFAYLNFGWAGPIHTRMGAVDAMFSEGIELLAPLSLRLDFDAEFYREFDPSIAGKKDADCYRRWLFQGLEAGQPGSSRQFFENLDIELEAFPASFQWQRYLSSARDLPRKTDSLVGAAAFCNNRLCQGSWFCKGDDAATFFKALGARFHRNHAGIQLKHSNWRNISRHWTTTQFNCWRIVILTSVA